MIVVDVETTGLEPPMSYGKSDLNTNKILNYTGLPNYLL